MLERLTVRNLAVVESADVVFGGGLNIITGETGAGKSVLMGALGLVLGARADASAVRDGAKEARVEAEFTFAPGDACAAGVAETLEAAGLPPCEDGRLSLRRTVSAAGGGRAQVNDAAATVQTLRALGRRLADVCGPDDSQSLLDEGVRRRLLDAWGKTDTESYSACWDEFSRIGGRLESLRDGGESVEEERERLRYSVDELEEAALSPEDDDELPARHAAAAHAAELLECAGAAVEALSGDDGSAAAALAAAGARLAEMSRHHPPAAEWREELESIAVRVQELSGTVTDFASRVDADPETMRALDERLSLVQRLKRKYNVPDVASLVALKERRAERLAELDGREELVRGLEAELEAARKRVEAAGAKLGRERRRAAEAFSKRVTEELRDLGFLKAEFAARLTRREPDSTGCDTVEFMFGPNPGEPERPIEDIASTGEMARVMLAVKTAGAGLESVPLLVFDEIDSNIGGETGRAVGAKLRAAAERHQVIAITHLPQTAAWGQTHLAVAKTVAGGRTRSTVGAVEGEKRVAELSRMLGGGKTPGAASRHAEELLEAAARGASARKRRTA